MSISTSPAATPAAPAGQLTDSAMGEPTVAPVAPEAVTEAVAVAPVAEVGPTEAEKTAARFAALGRREKALRQQERAAAARLKELEAREASTAADTTKYISREDFKKNPYKYMQENDLTLEQVAEIVMNNGKSTPEKLLEQSESKFAAKMKELEDRLAAKEVQEQEEKINTVLQNFKMALTDFVNDTPEYEMIRSQESDGVQLVYDVIDQHYNEQVANYTEENGEEPDAEVRRGFVLSNKDASDMVEKYLLDQEKARIAKLRALNKTKGLFEPTATKVEQKVKSPESPTLTNTLSAQVPSKDSKTLTDEESKREAAKLIKFVD